MSVHETAFESLKKGGRYILKSCNSLTFPPIMNMFWSAAKIIKNMPVNFKNSVND